MPLRFIDEEEENSLRGKLIIEKEKKKKEKLRKKLEHDHNKLMNTLRQEEDAKRIQRAKEREIEDELIEKNRLYLLQIFKDRIAYFLEYRIFINFSENTKNIYSFLTFDKWIIERERLKKAFEDRYKHIIGCNLCSTNTTERCSYKNKIIDNYSFNDERILINFFGLFNDDDDEN